MRDDSFMKLVELKCKNCGAVLKVQPDSIDIHCDHCKANYRLDDEAQHIKYDDMEKAGYDYEHGRIKARQEHEEERRRQKFEAQQAAIKAKKDAKMRKWTILAWIFLFPFMFSYWLWTRSIMEKKYKIILTISVWLLFIIIATSSSVNNSNSPSTGKTDNITTADMFEAFTKRYDGVGDDKITDLSDYDIKDKSAEYYQVEFRLSAYDEAVAKVGKIKQGHILLVKDSHGEFSAYAFTGSREFANEVSRTIIKAIEPAVLNIDIDAMLAKGTVNGELLYGDIDSVVITDNVMVKSKNSLFATIPDSNEKNVAMRKCTAMEAADIYSTGIGKKTDNVFTDAKNTCQTFYDGDAAESFYEAVNIDWSYRSEETIDDKLLSYYTDKLGW